MAIPFIDDLIAWLYRSLARLGAALMSAGLLLGAVMIGISIGSGELPHWSALDLGVPLAHTSIVTIDHLLTFAWTEKLGIPAALLAIGASSYLIFGRRVRQIAQAEEDLYARPAPRSMARADR